MQHAEFDVDLPVSASRTRLLTGAAVAMVIATAALVEALLRDIPLVSFEVAAAPVRSAQRMDTERRSPAGVVSDARPPAPARLMEQRPVPAASAIANTSFPEPEPVQRGESVVAPSLVRMTPRVKADRTDVWAAFPKLDRESQLALQDALPPDPRGPGLERAGGVIRLITPVEEGQTIFWVSEESGYLGTGPSVAAPERDDSVRAVFVGRGLDGSVHVSSSTTLEVRARP